MSEFRSETKETVSPQLGHSIELMVKVTVLLEHLLYTRHCAKHDAHAISLHAQNNPIRENYHYPHFTDKMALSKSCQRIQMSDSQAHVLHYSEVDIPLPGCPALPGAATAVTCHQSHQLLFLLCSNARCARTLAKGR